MHIDPIDDCTFWYTNEYVADDRVCAMAHPNREASSTPAAPAPPPPPERPRSTATPGDQKVDVSFTSAPNGADLPVVELHGDGVPRRRNVHDRGSGSLPTRWPASVTGLDQRAAVHVHGSRPRTTLGDGPASAASAPVTPRTVPGAPTRRLGGTPGNTDAASVTGQPPANDGGAPISSSTPPPLHPAAPPARQLTPSCTVVRPHQRSGVHVHRRGDQRGRQTGLPAPPRQQ